MTVSILHTKLFIPPVRQHIINRDRLLQRIEAGLTKKMILISAPAGFGKTTLLSDFLNQNQHSVGWISLDHGDNDPARFVMYLVATIQHSRPEIGLQDLLEHLPGTDLNSVLTDLLNRIMAFEDALIIVFDDYHLIVEPKIQELLVFAVENMPPNLRFIISSRSDPPWPLARFRVRNELIELRDQDLRFSIEETTAFLRDLMGLDLSAQDILALENRTEGWIAGLQMAAISMQGRTDIAGFIHSFTGSHRFVLDYLMDEVLNQQSPEVQEFLLKTSILDRLSGPLCDAVVAGNNSQSLLTDLQQKNLFVVSLDDQRRWFRYHHLFGDLLQNHLMQTSPSVVDHLRKNASLWFEENDLIPDAITQALAANDPERIAQLVEGLAVHKLDHGELKLLLRWLDRLPGHTLEKYPLLQVAQTWGLFNLGQYDAVENKLKDLERSLSGNSFPQDLSARVHGHAAAIRSYMAEIRDDATSAIQEAEQALDLLSDRDLKLRSFVSIRWANCLVWNGEFDKAIQAYRLTWETSQQIGDGHLAITALSELATVQIEAGNLKQAIETNAEVLKYAEMLAQNDGRKLPAMATLYRQTAIILREINKLSEARQYIENAIQISEQWGEKETYLFCLLNLTSLQITIGEIEHANQNTKKILEIANQISPFTLNYCRNWMFYYELYRGQTDNYIEWLDDNQSPDDLPMNYADRLAHLNFALYQLHMGKFEQALNIIQQLLVVVEQVGAKLFTLRYKVLEALILHHLKQSPAALGVLAEILPFARQQGFIRSIIDMGRGIDDLLRLAIAKGIEVEYCSQLLTAITAELDQTYAAKGLVDPLSDRELEVLRLLITDLTTPQVAEELFVSVSTVRSHIKNIYSKLNVHSRHEAIVRAQELQLI